MACLIPLSLVPTELGERTISSPISQMLQKGNPHHLLSLLQSPTRGDHRPLRRTCQADILRCSTHLRISFLYTYSYTTSYKANATVRYKSHASCFSFQLHSDASKGIESQIFHTPSIQTAESSLMCYKHSRVLKHTSGAARAARDVWDRHTMFLTISCFGLTHEFHNS